MGDWLCPHKIATKSMAMRRDLLFFRAILFASGNSRLPAAPHKTNRSPLALCIEADPRPSS